MNARLIAAVVAAVLLLGVEVADAHPGFARAAIRPAAEPRLVALGGVEEARRWARRRAGAVAFAVLAPGARIHGLHDQPPASAARGSTAWHVRPT